jgi:uncharacterized protein YbjT (DUF2867 family)
MFVVAGVSGRTGQVVAEVLLAQGCKVRVLVRDARTRGSWDRRGAEVALLSLDDGDALTLALQGAAGFYTLLPEDGGKEQFDAHRRRMANAIAGAVKASRIPHVVLLSAAAAVLTQGNGPAQALHHLENALRATGTTLTAIRASYFQENVLTALPAAKYDGIFPNFLPSADAAIPTVATRDIGRLAARCLLEPPAKSEVIDLVGPMYSMRQVSEKLAAAMGKGLRVVDIPAALHVEVLAKAGLSRQFAAAIAETYACFASGLVSPRGDRMISGTTTLDDILPGLVGGGGSFSRQ